MPAPVRKPVVSEQKSDDTERDDTPQNPWHDETTAGLAKRLTLLEDHVFGVDTRPLFPVDTEE